MTAQAIARKQPRPPYHVALMIFITFVLIGLFWGYMYNKAQAQTVDGLPQGLLMVVNFTYIGTITSASMIWMWRSPKKKKLRARRFSMFAVGLWLVIMAGVLGTQNLQLEGFFFALLSGAMVGGTVHYSVSKIFGPLIFSRSWCGWACWTAMVLDSLPFKRSPGRLPQRWLRWTPHLHFALSLGLILFLWYGIHYRPDVHVWGLEPFLWFAIGNALYYVVAIGMAYALKDNRAFCKYLCPVNVPIRIGARFSLIKMGGNASLCSNCGACTKMCPMDIPVSQYIQNNQRVLSDQCIMCQQCVNVCPKNALSLTLGLDGGSSLPLTVRKTETTPAS
ncbi:4Fe-4S binding protein [Aggregatilineales bacterium SYSU G02658]